MRTNITSMTNTREDEDVSMTLLPKNGEGIYKKYSFLLDQIEVSKPLTVLFFLSRYRRLHHKRYSAKIRKAKRQLSKEWIPMYQWILFYRWHARNGITGCFTNVNIYDDEIRLLQRRFTSPIAKEGINFYKYYLMDTLTVDKDAMCTSDFLCRKIHRTSVSQDTCTYWKILPMP